MYSVAVLTALTSLLGEGRGVEGQRERGTLLSITRFRRISSSSSARGMVNLENLPDAGNRMSFPVSSSLNLREQLIEE